MNDVGIVLINYNSSEQTTDCLLSLQKISYQDGTVHIIIVDNNSLKEQKELSHKGVKSLQKKDGITIQIIENSENEGFAEGNNIGMRVLLDKKVEYIMILNNDTVVDKHIITPLKDMLDTTPSAAFVSPKVYFAKGYEFHKDRYTQKELGNVIWYAGGVADWANVINRHRGVDEVDKGQYDSNGQTDFVTGCCFMTRANVLEDVGLFDEKYFMYYEDSDLSQRAIHKGYTLWYVADAKVWHKNASSSGGSGSSLQDYFISRNRLLFGMLYAPFRAKFALLRESIKILIRGRHWQRQGVKDFYLSHFGRGSYHG